MSKPEDIEEVSSFCLSIILHQFSRRGQGKKQALMKQIKLGKEFTLENLKKIEKAKSPQII